MDHGQGCFGVWNPVLTTGIRYHLQDCLLHVYCTVVSAVELEGSSSNSIRINFMVY